MATADEYAAWIVKNADKKGTPDFDTVAKAYQSAKAGGAHAAAQAQSDAFDQKVRDSVTGDMSGFDKFAAGAGKAVGDIGLGLGQRLGQAVDSVSTPQKSLSDLVTGAPGRAMSQRLGLPTQADVDEAKRRDAPLMSSGAGLAGNITGNIMSAVPLAMIPGAASIPGAALVGGAMGFAQPTATGESVLRNTAVGAGLGAGSVVAGQLAGAGYRGLKAIAEPFTAAGPQRIAGRTIQRFASDPASIANVTNQPTVTGALPTLAEQTGDVGLARLQDSLRSVDPQINNALAARAADNNGARVNALRAMAGQDGARDFAVANRAGTTQPMYEDAFKVIPDTTQFTPGQQRAMDNLLRRPAVQDAMDAARANAANSGANVGPSNASGSIEGMHQMKLAMDDAISKLENGTAAQVNKAAGIRAAQKDLVSLMEQISPEYKNARGVYAQMSQPVNQMDIAATLARKGFSNGSDLSGNPTINRNALMGAMKDEPALIRQATGRPVANALSDVMSPEQMNMLNTLRSEVDRAGAVATAGNGPGSATAQRLASQNILRQVITPGGTSASPTFAQRAGQAVVDNTLANTVAGKATNWIYSGIAEPKIQQALAKAVLQPEEAKAALAAAQQQGIQLPNNLLTRLIGQARRVSGASAAQSTRQP